MQVPESHWWLLDGPGGSGMAAAWALAKGKGVSIGLIDGGVWTDHPDLAAQGLGSGLPPDAHGTQVAGLIVGDGGNALGGVGAAPLARLHVTALDFNQPIWIEALAALLAAQAAVDVSNNSWGFAAPLGDSFAGPGTVLAQALDQALATGRGGLGTVFVFAAGHGAGDAGLHNLNGGRRTIGVAASDQDGQVTGFSTPGANVFLAAPGQWLLTADGAMGQAQVSGTSFAAPLVSSAVALMLQVNPKLGFRDVQSILALTARPTEGMANGGMANGGGLLHDRAMGFGLLDADAAVRLARHWQAGQTLANEAHLTGQADGQAFHLAGGVQVEWVELRLLAQGGDLAGVMVYLISPSGHEILVLDGAAGLSGLNHSISVAGFRGEDSGGLWRLRVAAPDAVTVTATGLEVFGKRDGPEDVMVLTDAFQALAAADPGRQQIIDSDGGRDVLNLAAATVRARVDLAQGEGQLGRTGFHLSGYENLIGTAKADVLAGDGGRNRLTGDDGNDRLIGRGGRDILTGSDGRDVLIGGKGADVFVLTGRGTDRIVDFNPDEDQLALTKGTKIQHDRDSGALWLSHGGATWLAARLPQDIALTADCLIWL